MEPGVCQPDVAIAMCLPQWLLSNLIFLHKWDAPSNKQNPIEVLWLQAKNFVRKFYHLCKFTACVTSLFTLVTHHQIFDFPKLYMYE